MTRKIIDRTGETLINSFGSKMIITEYRNSRNIDVYFPEYNWIAKNTVYVHFKNGNIKCPFEPRVLNRGFIGEGAYKAYINGRQTPIYTAWTDMLDRCYNPKSHEKRPTYIDCEVTPEWLNFQNFGEWYTKNYYCVPNETMCVDKDILYKGNKIYGPDTCVIVPQTINILFAKSDSIRGLYPIGVTYNKKRGKYIARCSFNNSIKHIGYYNSVEEAFEAYKDFKEELIKSTADEYKKHIPDKLYNAMYNYEVNIND